MPPQDPDPITWLSTSKKSSPPSTSFTTAKVNASTWVIREDDVYREHPLIYVKIHPSAPVILLSDTGCDEPSEKHKHDDYTHLRAYLENYPIPSTDNQPLNPKGKLQYYIICTHCHYDHTAGIPQFLNTDKSSNRTSTTTKTEIIASSSGRDFVQSDFSSHSLFKYIDKPVAEYEVSYWVNSFERLNWPLRHSDDDGKTRADSDSEPTDLRIMVLHTPGHTPDSLAWYDESEMHLSVGDSFYEEGEDGMAVQFPKEGNLIEWVFSMQKLLVFIRSENAQAEKRAAEAEDEEVDDWTQIAKRVKVSCAHQTYGADGEEIMARLERFAAHVFQGEVPVVREEHQRGETYCTWRDDPASRWKMSLQAPARLMDDARRFFSL